LSEDFSIDEVEIPGEFVDILIAYTAFEIGDCFFIHSPVVVEDSNGEHRCHVAEIPIGPVVIEFSPVVPDEKIVILGEEYIV
jgi:hypothetical protein